MKFLGRMYMLVESKNHIYASHFCAGHNERAFRIHRNELKRPFWINAHVGGTYILTFNTSWSSLTMDALFQRVSELAGVGTDQLKVV